MVIYENISFVYPLINQAELPKELIQAKYSFWAENLDLYNEDDTIKQLIDTFCGKLDEFIRKSRKVAKSDGTIVDDQKVFFVSIPHSEDKTKKLLIVILLNLMEKRTE